MGVADCVAACLFVQVGLSWLDRWAKNLSGKDQGPFLCHQICGALLAAEQTGTCWGLGCALGPIACRVPWL